MYIGDKLKQWSNSFGETINTSLNSAISQLSERKFNIILLGAAGSGKTTLKQCMMNELENVLGKNYVPFGADSFALKTDRSKITVEFYDYPGSMLNTKEDKVGSTLQSSANESTVFIITLSSPYFMEAEGRFTDKINARKIQQIIKSSMPKDNSGRFYIFAPLQCEKYTQYREDEAKKLKAGVVSVFSEIIESLSVHNSMGKRFSAAVVPVETVGNVKFDHFDLSPWGSIIRNVYVRERELETVPRNADQVLKLSLLFILNEFIHSGGLITNVLVSGYMKELFSDIRHETDLYSFDILFGLDYITGA